MIGRICLEEEGESMSEPWEIIRTVGTDEEATLLAGFLRSHEIPAEVESLLFHQEPMTFGQLGEVRVRVPQLHAASARRLLAELEDGETVAPEVEGGEQ